MEETKSHKIVTAAPKRELPKELPVPRREIAVRGKKSKSGDRSGKGDGSVVLVCLPQLYYNFIHLLILRIVDYKRYIYC